MKSFAFLFLLLVGTHCIPQGFTTWFRGDTCPSGWEELQDSKGRLIVAVSDGTTSGLTVNTPLSDGEDRTHEHAISSKVTLVVKSISAIGCCNPDGACYGSYPLEGEGAGEASGLPFVQLLLCSFVGDSSSDPIPYGTISFFDNSQTNYDNCSGIPGTWATLQSVVGRSILPGYGTGLFTSVSKPLESQEDRKHSHNFVATIKTEDQSYAGVAGCCDKKLAIDQTYTVKDVSESESSNIPYLQLLTCVSQDQTFDSGLPDDAYIFTEISCPSGYRLSNLLSGRYLVSNPENGRVGNTFGGKSLPAQTTLGNNHTHPFTTSFTTKSCEVGLASGCCGSGYVRNEKYTASGITEESGVDFPFISVPICEKD